MIGQVELLNKINKLVQNGFPRFVVITGPEGQGKQTLMCEIALKLQIPFVHFGIKVDEIREMIKMAYKQTEPIIYVIANADKMSLAAKNSLLKVIEEPPQNAYFIMTLQQIENTLPTIKSRCQEFKLQNYTETELDEMMNKINPLLDKEERVIILDIAENFYQINLINSYGVKEFYKYVEKVVNNIYRVQSANSFKISEKIDIKGDGEGYDLNLFFQAFKSICYNNMVYLIDDDDEKDYFINYHKSIEITSKYQHKLNITGINRQGVIDRWILDIRKIWRD